MSSKCRYVLKQVQLDTEKPQYFHSHLQMQWVSSAWVSLSHFRLSLLHAPSSFIKVCCDLFDFWWYNEASSLLLLSQPVDQPLKPLCKTASAVRLSKVHVNNLKSSEEQKRTTSPSCERLHARLHWRRGPHPQQLLSSSQLPLKTRQKSAVFFFFSLSAHYKKPISVRNTGGCCIYASGH